MPLARRSSRVVEPEDARVTSPSAETEHQNRRYIMRYVFTSVVIVFAACSTASAQTASEHLLLQRTAAVYGDVVVRDDSGGNIRGRLIDATDAVLELETRSGRRRLDLSRVSRITRPGDPIIDGVFRGMGTATAWCVLMCDRTESGNVRAGAFVGHVAIGGAIGGLFDRAVNGGRALYQRRSTPMIHIGAGPRGGAVTMEF
jgi:hypothetical protein